MPSDFSGLYPIHKPEMFDASLTPSMPTSAQEYREQIYQDQLREEQIEDEVGFFGGIKHSALGTVARVRMLSEDPFGESKTYIPTDDERKKILEAFNYNEESYKAVAQRLNSADDIDNAIAVVKDNIEYNQKEAEAGILDGLASGLGDAVVDPVNWASAVATGGAATALRLSPRVALAFRTGMGGASNVASGLYKENYTGVEANMMIDAMSGLAFGFGAEVLPGVMSRGARKFYAKAFIEANTIKNNFAPENQGRMAQFFNNTTVGRKTKQAASTLVGYFSDGINKMTVNGTFADVAPDGDLRKIVDNFVKNEQGVFDPETQTYRQYGTRAKVIEEYVRDGDNEILRLQQESADMINYTTLMGFSSDDLSEALVMKLSGLELPAKYSKITEQVDVLSKYIRGMLDADNSRMISIGKWQEGAIDADVYIPRVWDVYKISDHQRRIGGTHEHSQAVLYRKIVNNVLEGTRKNKKALQNVYKAYTLRLQDDFKPQQLPDGSMTELEIPSIDSNEFRKWMEKEADNFAMGVVDQGSHRDSVFDPREATSSLGDGGRHRIPWDTSFVDADGFAIDQLRLNIFDTVTRYHRRVTGELAVKEVFGADGYMGLKKDVFDPAIKNEIDKLPAGEAKARKEAYIKAADILAKKTFGIGLRDYDEGLGVGTALSEILRNLTFATANSYMGLLNYTEVASGVMAYGPSLLLKSIPGFGKLFTRWAKGGMTPAEEKSIMDLLFTREPVVKSIWGDIRRHNRYRYGNHKILADIVSSTQVLANALPTTKFLQASQINIVDTARGMMLSQLIRGTKKGFFRKGTLTRLNITAGDMVHLKRQLKKAFAVDVKDGISVRDINAITRDPRALNTLRRLGDYAADETILRPSLGDTFMWDTTASPIINLLAQFKSFAIRSWSKRFVKSLNRAKEGDATYQAGNFTVSLALATLGNMGITAIRTMGMSDEDRDKYWNMSLGWDSGADLDENLLNAVQSSFLRSSLLAAPALVLNAAGFGTFAKTTADASIVDPDAPKLFGRISVGDALEQNIPAFRTATNYANLGVGLANYLNISRNPEDYTYEQEQRNINNLWKSLKAVTPQWSALTNIPLDGLKDEYTDLE